VAINNKTIGYWEEFQKTLKEAKANPFTVTIDRDGTLITKEFTLEEEQPLGVYPLAQELLVKDEYSVFAAIPLAFTKTFDVLSKQVRQFKLIFNNKVQGYKKVKGPIGIVEMMSPTWDWYAFWGFTAMFSVWLAFVNILPIPALDGGHVMFLLYEMITGKKPSEKTLERGQIVGFVIVMGLMVVIFGNDIWNVIKRFL
jgi:regulator of sigma E protease